MIVQSSYNLRRSVVRGTARRFEHFVRTLESGHSEVGNLDIAFAVKKQILGLKIAVTNVEAVTVIDTGDTEQVGRQYQ